MIQKGMLCRQVKITGAARVSKIAIFLNVMNSGERNSTVGSICVIRIANSTARLILSLKRASPYADKVASKVEMIVVAAAMTKLFLKLIQIGTLPLINNCDMYPSSSIFSGKKVGTSAKISFDDLREVITIQ